MGQALRVSPGFRPRPSLSGPCMSDKLVARGLASVSPGFRPRPSLSGGRYDGASEPSIRVSPGFRPRPSLSELRWRRVLCRLRVSPGFRPRPSLSDTNHRPASYDQSVGYVSPGFRPRPSLSGLDPGDLLFDGADVSPGFRPRPSLSGDDPLRGHAVYISRLDVGGVRPFAGALSPPRGL